MSSPVPRRKQFLSEQFRCAARTVFHFQMSRRAIFPPYLLGILTSNEAFRCRLCLHRKISFHHATITSSIPIDGLKYNLTSRFFLDSSRVRAVGQIQIDCPCATVSLRLSHRSRTGGTNAWCFRNICGSWSSRTAAHILRELVRFAIEGQGAERP